MTTDLILEAQSIIADHLSRTTNPRARSCISDITLHPSYGEPGYPEGPVALGDWNTITTYDRTTHSSTTIDDTPARLAEALEAAGLNIDWSDEWVECSVTQRIYRSSPSSYGWQPSYIDLDGDIIGMHTLLDSPDTYIPPYLDSLSGNPNCAINLSFPINPTDYGYTAIPLALCNGLHGGQCSSPTTIAECLRTHHHITDFLFRIESISQFDLDFSLFIHSHDCPLCTCNHPDPTTPNPDEPHSPDCALAIFAASLTTNGADPATILSNALKNAPLIPPSTPGNIIVTTINPITGEATSKEITPEDFIEHGIN